MKHILIIFSLLLTSVSWSKDIDDKDLVYRDGLYYEKFTNEPFTGKLIGKIKGKIKEGKRVGEWLWYYDNGQLQMKNNYKDGKQDGEKLRYYDNGHLQIKVNYKEGKWEGKFIEYHKIGITINNGVISNIGPISNIGNYKNNEKEGKWLNYDKNGKLKKTEIYKNDKLIETIKH